ncbi:glycosyltransferase family 2 protein [Spongiactinospora sp. TRM90649]|uniref:glycosyltransferase family 2 protein n=1 Tax=Spongiactinospora sp. TRM90649 TaxID=3031114 RepID=UPI0023F7055C|nr:glycosyltransferase family 2 protein [Spongiactinospora sp. TRM90649]MDF5752529.1 glycosyltransferase [Spongiactinospora sp. TRM90649]
MSAGPVEDRNTPGGPRIRGNDYTALTPPAIGSWTPSLTVTVVVPAYNGQDKLDLVLAGLSAQTYPQELLEVVVVDNGSAPPLRLGAIRPELTRMVVCETPGRASARNAGLAAATGDVVHWLDSDVVLAPDEVEAHMRWHHLAPYLVVTSYLRFTGAPLPLPSALATALADHGADGLAKLFEPAEPHQWLVDLLERTGGLVRDPHRAFSLHVGGATSVAARLLKAAGPMDTDLILGQDTELGYRLAQAGAVFVPDPQARGYHLGPSMRMRDKTSIDRVSHAYIGDRVPSYRWLRSHPARQWKVPYVRAIVEAAGYDDVRATVDSLLGGTIPDLAVEVVGPWSRLDPERRAPLTDPDLDLVLIGGHYAHESRVRLAENEPEATAAEPFRLRIPAGWAAGEESLARILDLAREQGHGLINVLLDEREDGVVAARLERSAAFARAAIVARPGEDLDDVVDDTHGVLWVDGESYGFAAAAEAGPPIGRRSAYRARMEAADEVARLKKEAERLRGQIAKWRDEAGRWRKNAVEYRREVGTLRRELAAAKKAQTVRRAGLAGSLRRALRRRRRPE